MQILNLKNMSLVTILIMSSTSTGKLITLRALPSDQRVISHQTFHNHNNGCRNLSLGHSTEAGLV